jgi:hypothetical protein
MAAMGFSVTVDDSHVRVNHDPPIFICHVADAGSYLEFTLNVERSEAAFPSIEPKTGFVECADEKKHA